MGSRYHNACLRKMTHRTNEVLLSFFRHLALVWRIYTCMQSGQSHNRLRKSKYTNRPRNPLWKLCNKRYRKVWSDMMDDIEIQSIWMRPFITQHISSEDKNIRHTLARQWRQGRMCWNYCAVKNIISFIHNARAITEMGNPFNIKII